MTREDLQTSAETLESLLNTVNYETSSIVATVDEHLANTINVTSAGPSLRYIFDIDKIVAWAKIFGWISYITLTPDGYPCIRLLYRE